MTALLCLLLLGLLLATVAPGRLARARWPEREPVLALLAWQSLVVAVLLCCVLSLLLACAAQLREYFAGERTDFDLPLAPEGTPFQRRVWQELTRIGYGRTASYGEIAGRLGLTGHGARAVGLANGRNPIPVVIPCHRVVGADGSLTGYAGGIERKQLLLNLETDSLF